MHIQTLGFFVQRMESNGLTPDQITIKGKHSNRVAFTLPIRNRLHMYQVCGRLHWNAYRTTDTFIDREVFDRWQVDLV